MYLQSSLALALLRVAVVHGYANPGACSGACNIHDPALIQNDDGTYYRFSTGNNISFASASSIEGPWTALGSVLPGGSSIENSGRHLTCRSQESAIGLATSETMEEGTWTDQGSIGVTSTTGNQYNAIDANLLVDGSANYLTFGSFWQDIFQVTLNGDATSSTSTPVNVAFDPADTHPVEGAYLYKYGDYYYLFYSWGTCCGYDQTMPAAGQEYKIKVCRSNVWLMMQVDANGVACTDGGGTVVLESHDNVYGPGGQGVYTDPSLGPVLYYHYVDTTIGYGDSQKLFGWNAIDFSSGWPSV
ncbi:arabinan endo-1 [Aspergillus bombycis]|uniref:arabinan endo-1,5-alpha-L-arabinosidase n=1 Tax=Aspergillus bombycis TaxID=109264 RepID=A0A1F8A820_9EURO|nr:arabinan endo-1 [Aspergillus bombycis]OGM47505.1 arabinan endo-1 [Aspergillus bombycis]